MTIKERYELSCYEKLSKLHPKKEVYLVKHTENDSLCVEKIVDIYNKSIYMKLMELKVPNVPQIFQCVEEDDRLVVIEEYIHGSSLQRIFQDRGIFPERKIIKIMTELCDILEALHKCNPPIIHRDIKPSNIMVSNDGVVKLIDFNAAKEYVSGHIQDTLLMGTQEFAAPEQYGFGQSDQRTDIYALGVTMNFLLTGEFPKQKLHQGILGAVIKLCTAIDADNRYHNVGELKADLGLALKKLDMEAVKRESELEESEKSCNQMEGSVAYKQVYQDTRGVQGKESDTPVNSAENDKTAENNKSIFTRRLYKWQKWLPVGWRSGVIWKMIVAVYGYLFIFWVSFSMETTSEGVKQTGFLLWTNRIATFIILLGTVYIVGNYGNIQYQLPLMKKNKILHWILLVLYVVIFWFLVLFLLVLIESIA